MLAPIFSLLPYVFIWQHGEMRRLGVRYLLIISVIWVWLLKNNFFDL